MSKWHPSYMIAEAKRSSELEREVRKFIEEGWLPLGGVSVAITENMNYGTSYCQALWKPAPAEAILKNESEQP